jgi:hypothetical protein
MKKTIFAALVLTLTASYMQIANANICQDIGGVAIPNFYAEGEGKPIIISATLIGSVQNAAGKILSQRTTETGLEMDMEHYFGRADGGSISTKDLGILTSIPGKPGRFMIEITYDLQPEQSRGTLKGYGGQFKSYGLVDLRDAANLQGLVRYDGKICK